MPIKLDHVGLNTLIQEPVDETDQNLSMFGDYYDIDSTTTWRGLTGNIGSGAITNSDNTQFTSMGGDWTWDGMIFNPLFESGYLNANTVWVHGDGIMQTKFSSTTACDFLKSSHDCLSSSKPIWRHADKKLTLDDLFPFDASSKSECSLAIYSGVFRSS